ncbi:MAG: hypothetical protein WBO10_09865 [Pyrinomonadaceae bacterium]
MDTSANKEPTLGNVSNSEELAKILKSKFSEIGEYKLDETLEAGTSNDVNEDFFASEIKAETIAASTDARYTYDLGVINLSIYKFKEKAEAWKVFDFFDEKMVEAASQVFDDMKAKAEKEGKKFIYEAEKTDNSFTIFHKEKGIKLLVVKQRGIEESPSISHNGIGVNMTMQVSGNHVFIVTDNIMVAPGENKRERGSEVEDFYLQHEFVISELMKGL